MGRPPKYTKKTLDEAVERYFDSITRIVAVTEKKATGQRDEKGHMLYEDSPVINKLGESVEVTEYIVPPSVGGLAAFLGIHRDTWAAYCTDKKFSDTTTRARGRIHAYLEQESLTRSGKDLKGILFNLENNFDYRERVEVSGGIEDYLQKQEQNGERQVF